MLDIEIFRETPDAVRANLKKRGMDAAPVDKVIKLDGAWRKKSYELDQLRKERNELSARISKGKKNLMKKAKSLKKKMESLEGKVPNLKEERDALLMRMPNMLHGDVPEGKDEGDNVPVRYWGEPLAKNGTEMPKGAKPRLVSWEPKDHIDLLVPKYADIERAAKVAGARFYFLKDKLVQLEFALMRFAMDFMRDRGFTLVLPPYMIRREAVEGVTDFTAFEDTLYHVEGGDLYMVATAEHPLGAMHMDEILDAQDLPLKYAGVSPCFRKEAGSHGRDTKGVFRVHQFNKVEQFVFARPEDSWKLHEEITANAEELFRELGIPHRVVEICTGDMGYVAARKYDIEAWLPGQGRYREVVSSSNCTDWQSRRLRIRYRDKPGARPEFVHTLNSTAVATPRAAIAIIENYQQEDGSVKVPRALQPFLDFKEL